MIYLNHPIFPKALLLFIFFNVFFIGAQQNDSLVNIDFEKSKHQLFYRNYNESILLLQKILEHYKSSKNYSKIAEINNLLSQAYHHSRSGDAMLYAQNALTASRQTSFKNRLEEANALDNMGVVQLSMRQLKDAQVNHKKALAIRLRHLKNDTYGLASSHYYLGQLLRAKGDYKKASEYLNKVFNSKLDSTPKSTILIANANEVKGFLNYDLSNFEKALSNFEIAFDLAKDVYKKDNSYFVDIYNDLGLIYSIKEQFNESLKYYQKALNVSITNYGLDRHPSQAKIHYNMGTIYRRQNQKEKALYHTQKSLKMGLMVFEENHSNLFFPYSQIGQIYNDETGIPYIMKALKICEKSDNNKYLRISYLYDYLNEAYTNIGNFPEATNYALKALELRKDLFGKYNANTVRSHNNVSKSYISIKDYKNALHHINQAINFNHKGKDIDSLLTNPIRLTNYLDDDLLLESMKISADIYFRLYEKEGEKKFLKKSNLLYKKATSLIDVKRNRQRNYEDKIKFSGIVKSIYAKSIETEFLLNKFNDYNTPLDELFYFSEKSRANVLRELAKNTEVKNMSNISTKALELEKYLNAKIAKLTSEIINEIPSQKSDSSGIFALEGALFDLSKRKDSLEKQIETNFPKYYQLKYEKSIIKIPELQQRLNENTTFIEFFRSNNTIYAFIITKDTYHVTELSIKNLDEKIQVFNKTIINKNQLGYLDQAHKLYELLIEPIKNYFVGDHLIIVPDESLWHLQFDLLITSKDTKVIKKPRYLLFDYAISYANSASMLFEDIKSNNGIPLLNECIAFSYTNTDSIASNLEIDLPGSRKEIKELSTVFKGKYFTDTISSEANFKHYVDQYKLVHLALHAEIDSLDSKSLKIRFSNAEQDKEEDNILFSHELYGLNIPANLVVLSACNTGVGKVNKGEGILSIGNAFQYAGAQSLLLSRWAISDETTPKVMKLFYKNIKNGMHKDEALQKAKISYLSTTNILNSSPAYWGSFYILGNTDPIKLDNNSNLFYYGIAALLILMASLFFLKKRKK